MDVKLGDSNDLPQVIDNLMIKGFCSVDAQVCGGLSGKVLTEVQQRFTLGRFAPPPSSQQVSIADGLLGPEGSCRVASLSVPTPENPDIAEKDGQAVARLDEFMGELSDGLMEYLPAIGKEASARSVGMFNETSKSEYQSQELTEADASQWMSTFMQHRLMILFFLGPEEGTLELTPFETEGAVVPAVPQRVRTGKNTMVILCPDLISRKHYMDSTVKSYVFSCFINTQREVPLRSELPLQGYAAQLMQWIQDRMQEIKDMEVENQAVLDDLPKRWIRAMNAQFYRGQQACVRSSAVKLPGPFGWDTCCFLPDNMAGCDYVIEVPHRRFDINSWFYDDPKSDGWMEYKSYSRHGSFLDGEDLFDNKAFAMSLASAHGMPVSERWSLECGYEALLKAGWEKKKLQRAKGDVLVGVHSTENQFNNTYGDTTGMGAPGSVAREANIISFTLNIMGQSLTFDTDGSSSLVALWQGALEQSDDDSNGRLPPFSVVIGTAWNIVPAVFANFCQRRLLTTKGRCFAFNEGATGFVRGEGSSAVVLSHLFKTVDDKVVADNNGQGLVRSCDMMQCGKGAVLAAPSSFAIHETVALAVRSAGIQPGDVDVLECNAPGSMIIDIAEANTLGKVLRKDADDTCALQLTDMKTQIGNSYAASGMMGFVKVLHCMRNTIIGANNFLRCLNPHIDIDNQNVNILTEPGMLPVGSTGFSAVNSLGNSGTYVTAIAWSDHIELHAAEQLAGLQPAPCLFWPGGGGELKEDALPTTGYFLAGTFNEWANPVKMDQQAEGVYTAMMVLGDNRFEQFQIWLDGKQDKVIHPGGPRAPQSTAVFGPEEHSLCEDCTWQIDGRPFLPIDGGSVTELPNKDQGEPGAMYKVRLRVAGKYRLVDWQLQDQKGTPAGSKYYIVASWNNWEFEEISPTEPGLWSSGFVTLKSEAESFAVVRNKDWNQAFYPADSALTHKTVYGPDFWGRGPSWPITGEAGDQFKIDFKRNLGGGQDLQDVSISYKRK